jgi:hypothetical protein
VEEGDALAIVATSASGAGGRVALGMATGLSRCGAGALFASRHTVLMVTCTPALASATRMASSV